MKPCKLLTAMLLSLSLAVSAGCAQKPPSETESYQFAGVEPYKAEVKVNEALRARFGEYAENSRLAFSQNQPASAASFETEAYEDGLKLTRYIGEEKIAVIPETIDGKPVLAIGENCFKDSAVRAVKVPGSVMLIESGAFAGCNALTTLQLPFVGNQATSTHNGTTSTHFGAIFGAKGYENHALAVPASLDMVIIDGVIDTIADNAFAGCKTISAVILPATLTEIGAFAFYECRDLVYFATASEKFNIGDYAFGNCEALYAFELPGADRVGEGAFFGCIALEELTLPFVGGSPTENPYIGYLFGAEAADFNRDFVPKSLRKVTLNEHCKTVPDKAFYRCLDLDEVVFAEGVETVGVRSFYACRSLTSVTLPDSLREIGDDGFFGCDNLKTVVFGKEQPKVGMQVFYGCPLPENEGKETSKNTVTE